MLIYMVYALSLLIQDGPPPVTVDIASIMAQLLALGGFAALSAALINAGKKFGIVKDGQAPAVSLVMNALGMVVLIALRLFRPETDVAAADGMLENLAQALVYILAFVAQLGVAKTANTALKGAPVVGFSHSADAKKSVEEKPAEEKKE